MGSAETFVKRDRRRIPIEHVPLDMRGVYLLRVRSEMNENRLAQSFAAKLGPHEDVFEENSARGGEARIGAVPGHHTGRFAAGKQKIAAANGIVADEIARDERRRQMEFVLDLLIDRELAQEFEHERFFAGFRGADLDLAHTATS